MLLGKANKFDDDGFAINVMEVMNPGPSAYVSNSLGHVSPKKEFVHAVLSELNARYDVDTLIDVHTHPFSKREVSFSSVDDKDEMVFRGFLSEVLGEEINYASVVFSEESYAARVWKYEAGLLAQAPLIIRTQSPLEEIVSPINGKDTTLDQDTMDRTIRTLGVNTMTKISTSHHVTIVGVGGLGSVIAENLIHMGFCNITLVDDDVIEMSNLNRIVGATFVDAETKIPKVDAVKRHLLSINPKANVSTYKQKIEDLGYKSDIVESNTIFVATDNHSSRFYTQEIAFKYFIPLISAGVAITVVDDIIEDYSGEVIVIRMGDKICLNCLGRLNPTKIASESSKNTEIREKLVDRGYVKGTHVKEPAVKTLNSVIGALAVEELVNQFTNRTEHSQLIVYERNKKTSIYRDDISLAHRNLNCATCGIV